MGPIIVDVKNVSSYTDTQLIQAGPDKSVAQLPGTSPNFGWESDFLFHLPRKMYRIYREYCNSEPFSRCCGMLGKWLKFGFVRPCSSPNYLDNKFLLVNIQS